jgi:radical SAM protein (TIGR01212 family)
LKTKIQIKEKAADMPLPYLSLNEYFKNKYKTRVQKITISLPFACPHEGCSYCWQGSMPPGNSVDIPLKKQLENGILKGKKKYGEDTKFFAYFQSYTNTNDTPENLKKLFDEALNYHDIIGISAGTRPDTAPDEVLRLLDSYADSGIEPWIEFGLQSASDATLKKINRGHTVKQFVDAAGAASKTRLKILAHVIIGFPWETKDDFMRTISLVSSLNIHGIKIHPLYIVEGTKLGDEYKKDGFKMLAIEDYVKALADIIEMLPKDMVIMRFTAEGHPDRLLAPDYCRPAYKVKIKEMLVEEMFRRGSIQGCKHRG